MLGGINFQYYIAKQLPAPGPRSFVGECAWDLGQKLTEWINDRLLELSYTARDMAPLARDLGDDGPPFRWNAARRAQLRAEIDACFFHLYGLDRADTEYVLGTFPIANRKDPELSNRILAAYDAMATAIEIGVPYVSPLDPSPGHGPRRREVQEAIG